MRIQATEKPNQCKVWLTDAELEHLRRTAGSHRDDFVIQLGDYVGLRAFEIPQVTSAPVKRTEDGEHFRLRVPNGKDMSGNGGKPHDAYLPNEVESDLHRLRTTEGIDQDEPFVELTDSGVRKVGKRTARRETEQTDDGGFEHVSSHDLWRRFFQLLVNDQVNPRVVMAVGGWDFFQAIEPYLNAATPEVVNRAFEEASIA